MKKVYKINLFDVESIDAFHNVLLRLVEIINSEEFMQFIAGKCMLELTRICNERLGGFTEDDMLTSEIEKYRQNHKVNIKPKKIVISNNTMADLSHLSERTLANYLDGFSIAQAIEFGTGILGTPDDEAGWETQVNKNRDYNKGWYYEREGHLYWSKGFGGKFIYQELKNSVEQNLQTWFNEYINSKLS